MIANTLTQFLPEGLFQIASTAGNLLENSMRNCRVLG